MGDEMREEKRVEQSGEKTSNGNHSDVIKWVPVVVPLLAVAVALTWYFILDAVLVHA